LLAQFIKKGRRRRLVPPGTDHDSEAIDAAWLLRTRARVATLLPLRRQDR
jgi:hypothetical protein